LTEVIDFKKFLGEKNDFYSEEGELAMESVQELDNYRETIDYSENEFGDKEEDERAAIAIKEREEDERIKLENKFRG
jgi:hypothetical protein